MLGHQGRVWLAACALLAGCGGGGGGGGTAAEPSAGSGPTDVSSKYPTLIQDLLPDGTRIDMRAKGYFTQSGRDQWIYTYRSAASPADATMRREVSQDYGVDIILSEYLPEGGDPTSYRRSADGVAIIDPFNGYPKVVRDLVPTLQVYAEPFYPVGSTRTLIRQGDLGADIDQDGAFDRFRLDFSQTVVGFEPLTLPTGLVADTVHLRNVYKLTFAGSQGGAPIVSNATEEEWWAAGIGLVKGERQTDTPSKGSPAQYSFTIARAVVQNADPLVNDVDGRLIRLALRHTALAYDPARRRYYAAMAAADDWPNRIAIVDPDNGAVTYSPGIDRYISSLSISPDSSTLYAVLGNSTFGDITQIARLSLPDLVERERWSTGTTIRSIAVSPQDPSLLLAGTGNEARLMRQGTVLTTLTDGLGSGIGYGIFDTTGGFVYGTSNNGGNVKLRRLSVADSLAQTAESAAGIAQQGGLSLTRQGVMTGYGQVLQPATLAPVSNLILGSQCLALANQLRIACQSDTDYRMRVFDSLTFASLASLSLGNSLNSHGRVQRTVIGPPGQAALQIEVFGTGFGGYDLWLFSNESLRD